MSYTYTAPPQEEIDKIFDRIEHNDMEAYNQFLQLTQAPGRNVISAYFSRTAFHLNNKYDIDDVVADAQIAIFVSIRNRNYLAKCYDRNYYAYYISFYKKMAQTYIRKQLRHTDVSLDDEAQDFFIKEQIQKTDNELLDIRKANIYDLWKLFLVKLMEEKSPPHHVIYYAYAKILPLIDGTLTNSQNVKWAIKEMNERTVFILSDEFEQRYNEAPIVPVNFRWGPVYRQKLNSPYTAYKYDFPVTGNITLLGKFKRDSLYDWYKTIDKELMMQTLQDARKNDPELFEFMQICGRNKYRQEAHKKISSRIFSERSHSNEN
ncbi:MAG: hypothetical protein MR966_03105 [Lachnospiraceae bacterium]|nr:hypothetical protein [Lachnospiraceae bacterium]